MRTTRIWIAAVVLVVALGCARAARAQVNPDRLTPAQLSLACAPPAVASSVPARAPRILGGQDVEGRSLFGTNELLIVNAGTRDGIALGQRFFTRQPYIWTDTDPSTPHNVHTTGWLTIVSANETASIGHVDYACDGIMTSDYLEPFVAPAAPQPAADNAPGDLDFSALAHVLYGDQEQAAGGVGDYMLIDRGTTRGVTVAQRFTVYRDFHQPGLPLTEIAEGVVVTASPDRSVLRITSSRGSIESGDYAVPRRN